MNPSSQNRCGDVGVIKKRFVAFICFLCVWVVPLYTVRGNYDGNSLPPGSAQEATPTGMGSEDITSNLKAESSEITVGDPVHLVLEVRHPQGVQVLLPKLGREWTDPQLAETGRPVFEVLKQNPPEVKENGDGTQTTRTTLDVTLFKPGEYQTPPLAITVDRGNGKTGDEQVPSIKIRVKSVLSAGDEKLRDLKPQAELGTPPIWVWILGSILILAAIATLLWWWLDRTRKKMEKATEEANDDRPAERVALDELAHIEALRLVEEERWKEYFTRVSDCLRVYLEKRFGVAAMDRTTAEIRADMRKSSLGSNEAKSFVDLFSESDLVKFAKYIPDSTRARDILNRARTLIEATRPEEKV
jgi:hypothetical protein